MCSLIVVYYHYFHYYKHLFHFKFILFFSSSQQIVVLHCQYIQNLLIIHGYLLNFNTCSLNIDKLAFFHMLFKLALFHIQFQCYYSWNIRKPKFKIPGICKFLNLAFFLYRNFLYKCLRSRIKLCQNHVINHSYILQYQTFNQNVQLLQYHKVYYSSRFLHTYFHLYDTKCRFLHTFH